MNIVPNKVFVTSAKPQLKRTSKEISSAFFILTTNEDCQEEIRLINALPNNIKTFVI
jgi:hypothetical protein